MGGGGHSSANIEWERIRKCFKTWSENENLDTRDDKIGWHEMEVLYTKKWLHVPKRRMVINDPNFHLNSSSTTILQRLEVRWQQLEYSSGEELETLSEIIKHFLLQKKQKKKTDQKTICINFSFDKQRMFRNIENYSLWIFHCQTRRELSFASIFCYLLPSSSLNYCIPQFTLSQYEWIIVKWIVGDFSRLTTYLV